MNPEQARIEADLRGLISGDVFCDDLNRQMYATDASVLEIVPAAVVRPRNAGDVAAVVRYAAENRIPVHPRGSGSNVVGGVLGPGIVLDFSVYMRRIVAAPGEETVRVQAGAVLANINRQLDRFGRLFGPDPATRSVSTIGGTLALDSTGSHWLKYGSPRDWVRKLQLVMADGSIIEVGSDALPDPESRRLAAQIELVLGRRRQVIEECQPKTRSNHAGYNVADIVLNGQLDLARLITGSEGTLAIITEAVLGTLPLPRHRGVVLLFFDQMQNAVRCALDVLLEDVSACDLLDRRLLSLIRSSDERFQQLVPETAEAMLLVEVQAEAGPELRSRVSALEQKFRQSRQAAWTRSTCNTDERNFFWRMARRGVPMQFAMKGSRQAIPFVEDIAVAPENLPELFRELPAILNKCEVTATVFAHVGQGVVHLRPQLDISDTTDIARLESLAAMLFELVLKLNGTITGSHGDGLIRTPWLRRQYGRLYDVFAEVKAVFDPGNILNPGKIVSDGTFQWTRHLRKTTPLLSVVKTVESGDEIPLAVPAAKVERQGRLRKGKLRKTKGTIEPQTAITLPQIAMEAAQCNGCARCRTSSPDERMCPIFRLNPREEASPRAKANLIRGILNGSIPPEQLNSESLKQVADLCVNCHQCRIECPAGVDIPGLVIEAKAQHIAVNGLRMSEWLLTRLDVLYAVASRVPRLANWMIGNRVMRWALDRLFGIAQSRKLPLFSNRSFMRWAAKQRLSQPPRREGRKVLYFVDAFANWNDVELGMAACAVLKHNGFEVYVPPGQQISGMSMISAGVLDRARTIAAKNVELLAEGVRQGFHIVTAESSAALALRHEYLKLLSDPDARLVSQNCTDLSNFLWQLHLTGKLELDFRPLNYTVGYHLPCHQRVLGHVVAGMNLLRLVPGLKVERIEKGCSGMAGTYGLIRSNYRRSLRCGLPLIAAVREPHITAGCTECSTCKIQMEQGTVKSTIHPIKILAHAYGLMPELDDLFDRRSGELNIS